MLRFESRTGEFIYVARLRRYRNLRETKVRAAVREPLGLNRARSHVDETRNQVIFSWAG